MSLDNVAGTRLYIGGSLSMRRKEALRKANITHVVTVMRPPLEENLYEGYRHLVVDIDDLESENLIEWFGRSNAFIQEGLDEGGGVLVHCAMGQSRSTTILIAYLISIDPTLTPASQLTLVQQTRPMAKPNHSFMAQLYLYHRIGCPKDVDSAPEYQRWCWERRGKEAQTSGKPPNVAEVSLAPSLEDWKVRDGIVEDWKVRDGIAEPAASSEETARGKLYRCKRCRTPLASSAYVLPLHASQKCSHIWLQQPLSWMREELELGKLDGRFECPRKTCRTQVGRYAWQGLRCSCSQWVVPGLSLGVGKVDEVAGKGGGGGQENGGEKT